MTVRVDPDGSETHALFALADFAGRRVLEIGCGDGRLTKRYASRAAHVAALDPFAPAIQRARQNLPPELQGRVDYQPVAFEDFAAGSQAPAFDLVLLSWSLC